MTTAARALPRRRRLPRLSPRALAILAAVILIGFGGWLWLRSSSLVAVRQVRITGVSGPDAGQIRRALRSAARQMTTLNVARGALHTAVAPFPVVKHLVVSTSFPHEMTIAVVEQVPVAEITAGGRTVAVSADGTLLHDATTTELLPTLSLAVAPGGDRVTGETLQEVRLLAAAPYALLGHVSGVSTVAGEGFVAQLRSGPKIVFGAADALAAKWAAAAAVLADPTSAGADYIDVTDPGRPAAGAGQDTATGSAAAPGAGATTGTATNPVLPGVPATAPGGTSTAATGAATGGTASPGSSATAGAATASGTGATGAG